MRRRRDPLAGDVDALLRRVHAYVAYRIGPGADAEDITAETFERALRYRSSYDPARGDEVGWLIGIARGRLADAFRRSDGAAEQAASPAAEPFEDAAVARLALHEALAALGERDRELIALRYGADLTSNQIGAELGMTRSAVDVALHRALGRLRTAMEAEEPDAQARA